MKLCNMSQDQSFIWKSSLGGPVSWVGRSLWNLQGQANSFSQLMESQTWHSLTGSEWGEFRKETMASAHLDARHLSSSLHTTGAFQAATPVLELRGSESE